MKKVNKVNNRTCISLSKQNHQKLRRLGCASESMNDVVSRILNNLQLDALALDMVRGNEVR